MNTTRKEFSAEERYWNYYREYIYHPCCRFNESLKLQSELISSIDPIRQLLDYSNSMPPEDAIDINLQLCDKLQNDGLLSDETICLNAVAAQWSQNFHQCQSSNKFKLLNILIQVKSARCRIFISLKNLSSGLCSILVCLNDLRVSTENCAQISVFDASLTQIVLEIANIAVEIIDILSNKGLGQHTIDLSLFLANATGEFELLCSPKFLQLRLYFFHAACRNLIETDSARAIDIIAQAKMCVAQLSEEVAMDNATKVSASVALNKASDDNSKLQFILSIKSKQQTSSGILSLLGELPNRIDNKQRLLLLYQCLPIDLISPDFVGPVLVVFGNIATICMTDNSLEWDWNDLFYICKAATFITISNMNVEISICLKMLYSVLMRLGEMDVLDINEADNSKPFLQQGFEIQTACVKLLDSVKSDFTKPAIIETMVTVTWICTQQLQTQQSTSDFIDVHRSLNSEYSDCLSRLVRSMKLGRIHSHGSQSISQSQLIRTSKDIAITIVAPVVTALMKCASPIIRNNLASLSGRIALICELGMECIFIMIQHQADSDMTLIAAMSQSIIFLLGLLQRNNEALSLLTASIQCLDCKITKLQQHDQSTKYFIQDLKLIIFDLSSMKNQIMFRIGRANDVAMSAHQNDAPCTTNQEEIYVSLCRKTKGDWLFNHLAGVDWVDFRISDSTQKDVAPDSKLSIILEKIVEQMKKRGTKQLKSFDLRENRILLKISELASLLHNDSLVIMAASAVVNRYCLWASQTVPSEEPDDIIEYCANLLGSPPLPLKIPSSILFLNMELVQSSPKCDILCWIRCNWIVVESSTRQSHSFRLSVVRLASLSVQAACFTEDESFIAQSVWVFAEHLFHYLENNMAEKLFLITDIAQVIEVINMRSGLCKNESLYAVRIRLWSVFVDICHLFNLDKMWKSCLDSYSACQLENSLSSSSALQIMVLGCKWISHGYNVEDCVKLFGLKKIEPQVFGSSSRTCPISSQEHSQLCLQFIFEMKGNIEGAFAKILQGLTGQCDGYDTCCLSEPNKILFWLQCLAIMSNTSDVKIKEVASRWVEGPVSMSCLLQSTINFVSRSIISETGEPHRYQHLSDSSSLSALQCIKDKNSNFTGLIIENEGDWMFVQLSYLAQIERCLALSISSNQSKLAFQSLACSAWLFFQCGNWLESVITINLIWNFIQGIGDNNIFEQQEAVFAFLFTLRVCIDLLSSDINSKGRTDIDVNLLTTICQFCLSQLFLNKLHESVVSFGSEILNCVPTNQGYLFTEIMLRSQKQISDRNDCLAVNAQSLLQEYIEKEKQAKAASQKKRVRVSRSEPSLAESEYNRKFSVLSDELEKCNESAAAARFALESTTALDETTRSLADKDTVDLKSSYSDIVQSNELSNDEIKTEPRSQVAEKFKRIAQLSLKNIATSDPYNTASVLKMCGDVLWHIGKGSRAQAMWNDALDCLLKKKKSLSCWSDKQFNLPDKKSSILCLAILERIFYASSANSDCSYRNICSLVTCLCNELVQGNSYSYFKKNETLMLFQDDRNGGSTCLFSDCNICSPRCIAEWLLECANLLHVFGEYQCMIPITILTEAIAIEEIQDSAIEHDAKILRMLGYISIGNEDFSLALLKEIIGSRFQVVDLCSSSQTQSINALSATLNSLQSEIGSSSDENTQLWDIMATIHIVFRILANLCDRDISKDSLPFINLQTKAWLINSSFISRICKELSVATDPLSCQILMKLWYLSLSLGSTLASVGNTNSIINSCNGWLMCFSSCCRVSVALSQIALKIRCLICVRLQDAQLWKRLLAQSIIGVNESKSMRCLTWQALFQGFELVAHNKLGDIDTCCIKASELLQVVEVGNLQLAAKGLTLWKLAKFYSTLGSSSCYPDCNWMISLACCLFRKSLLHLSNHMLQQGWCGASDCVFGFASSDDSLSNISTFGQRFSYKTIFERFADPAVFNFDPTSIKGHNIDGVYYSGTFDRFYLKIFINSALQMLQTALEFGLIDREMTTTKEAVVCDKGFSCWPSTTLAKTLPISSDRFDSENADESKSIQLSLSDKESILKHGRLSFEEAIEISETLLRLTHSSLPCPSYLRNEAYSTCARVRSLLTDAVTVQHCFGQLRTFESIAVTLNLFEESIRSELRNGIGNLDLIQETALSSLDFICSLLKSGIVTLPDQCSPEYRVWLLAIVRRCQTKKLSLTIDPVASQRQTRAPKNESKKETTKQDIGVNQSDACKNNPWLFYLSSMVNRLDDSESFFWNDTCATTYFILQESFSWMSDLNQWLQAKPVQISVDCINVQWLKCAYNNEKHEIDAFVHVSTAAAELPSILAKEGSESVILLKKLESIDKSELDAVRMCLIQLLSKSGMQMTADVLMKQLAKYCLIFFHITDIALEERNGSIIMKRNYQGLSDIEIEVPVSAEFVSDLVRMATVDPCEERVPSKLMIKIMAIMLYS